MTLGELIAALEASPDKRLRLGFRNPHSYRYADEGFYGYYAQLAFEPGENVTVGEMLAAARVSLGSTFAGWKGGTYTMDEDTEVWLADDGCSGETIGPRFLELMLTNEAEDSR